MSSYASKQLSNAIEGDLCVSDVANSDIPCYREIKQPVLRRNLRCLKAMVKMSTVIKATNWVPQWNVSRTLTIFAVDYNLVIRFLIIV